jgi:putative two-component system response regulator
MSTTKKVKRKILIVDDSAMNRDILTVMLGNEYQIIEAENGSQAIAILQKDNVSIDLVLLDIVMPVMDGFDVLAVMNKNHWIEDIPVIMISAENSRSCSERAYEMGVTDFISRPFDALIVRRRIDNTIMLYAKQKKLAGMVAEQIYEKEKNNSVMINILSHIVEFRNGESGLHILHVKSFTEILLKRLVQISHKYKLSSSDITLISNASALHDIGKISIPDAILNKPGRLTNEEFEIMKTHSMAGANMLQDIEMYKDEPLIKVAYEICRWHHERYDGRGYPDGLKGDDIPISAQIVALADVYDALTSERVYKKAFSHEKALEMILNGECGTFNPLLLECLKYSESTIKNELKINSPTHAREHEVRNISAELQNHNELNSTERTLSLLEYERVKNKYYSSLSKNILFEFTLDPPMTVLSSYGAECLGVNEITMNPTNDAPTVSTISPEDFRTFIDMVRCTTPENSTTQFDCKIKLNGTPQNVRIYCKSIWSNDEDKHYKGVIGEIQLIDNKDNMYN